MAFQSIEFALTSQMERLCCYANLVNLMRLHGCVEHGSPDCVTSWVTWSKNVHYILGPLGKVSLFDLEFSFLRHSQPAPGFFDSAVLAHFVDKISKSDPRSEFVCSIAEPALVYVPETARRAARAHLFV